PGGLGPGLVRRDVLEAAGDRKRARERDPQGRSQAHGGDSSTLVGSEIRATSSPAGDAGPRPAGAARALRGRPRGPARGRSRDGPTGQRSAFVLSSRAMTKPALVVCSALLVLACTKQEVDTTPPEPAPPEPVVAEPEP